MPIIWRYLLVHYFKVQVLCVLSFVTILVMTRLGEIAHFATLGPEGLRILLFAFHQIPYILPIAIPISGLISAIILIQRLSRAHELTALRAAGLSLSTILTPILLAGVIMALANFYIVSELSTHSHLSTGLLKNELRAFNPLLLVHNKHLLRLKGVFYRSLGPSHMGETSSDVILALPNSHQNRLNLLLAKKLSLSQTHFTGEHVSYLTPFQSSDTHADSLWVENIRETSTEGQDFSELIQKKIWNLNPDHLRLPLLLAHLKKEKSFLVSPNGDSLSVLKQKSLKKTIQRCHSEIIRRVSIALAAFTFTFMGAAFGLTHSRNRSNRGIACVLILAAIYLVAFFVAKDLDECFITATTLYLTPHLLIIFCSVWAVRRVTKGI